MNNYNVTTDQDDHWWKVSADTAEDAAGRGWRSCDYYTDDTDHKGEWIRVRVQRVSSSGEPVGEEHIFTRVFE